MTDGSYINTNNADKLGWLADCSFKQRKQASCSTYIKPGSEFIFPYNKAAYFTTAFFTIQL